MIRGHCFAALATALSVKCARFAPRISLLSLVRVTYALCCSFATFACFLFLLCPNLAQAQSYETDHFGFNAGLSFHFGTHQQELGLSFKAFYRQNHVQANVESGISYIFKGLGPDKKRLEAKLKLGLLGALGPQNMDTSPFLHVLSNHTAYPYAFVYAYHFYWDNIQSAQMSGSFAFHAKQFELLFENDILAFTGQDKFRTGALGFSWHNEQVRLRQQLILWTGNQLHPKAVLVRDSNYPSRFGYCDLSETPYGTKVHGIFSLGIEYAFPYAQIGGLQIGIDAEQIRHFFQNKIIHDFPLIPAKWNKAKTPHLPMLQDDGSPYLFNENQAIRKARLYIDFFFNDYSFY